MKPKTLLLPLLLPLLSAGLFGQAALTVTEITGHAGTYELNDTVNFSFTLTNTTPAQTGGEDPAADEAANARNTARNITLTARVEGVDIYGNAVVMDEADADISLPSVGDIGPEGTVDVQGSLTIPNDGTLHNPSAPGYRIIVEGTYDTEELVGDPPVAEPITRDFTTSSSADILVEVTPNLIFTGLSARPGTYRGGDIIQVTAELTNLEPVGASLQTRPLQPATSDEYRTNLFLSDNPELLPESDFQLGFFTAFGSFLPQLGPFVGTVNAQTPDGRSQIRQVRVANTPAAITSFGRDYSPQSDDGFFDRGQTLVVSLEVQIPANFEGEYFLAGITDRQEEVPETDEDDNERVNDTTPSIQIISTNDPTIEPVSERTDDDGNQIAESDGTSDNPSVSEDGDWIVFDSLATNLDPDVPSGGNRQIYLRNRETREITLISAANDGTVGNRDSRNPAISADGRWIAFESGATNFEDGAQGGQSQIFVYDRQLQRLVRVSESADGTPANASCFRPTISEDGRYVAYESFANNLDPAFGPDELGIVPVRQVYLTNRDVSGSGSFDIDGNISTTLASVRADGTPAQSEVRSPALSLPADAIALQTADSLDLAYGGEPEQIWWRAIDPTTGDFTLPPQLVSVDDSGAAGKDDSSDPAVNGGMGAAYGLQIAFVSKADNLVPNDTNEVPDIFVRDFSDPGDPVTKRLSVSNPRVAFGQIILFDPDFVRGAPNRPANQPLDGDTVKLNDGTNPAFTFTFVDTATALGEVEIGANASVTRDNLVAEINEVASFGQLNLFAYASDAPSNLPGFPAFNFQQLGGYAPGVTVFNTEPGAQGNQPILVDSVEGKLAAFGMAEGGVEAVDLQESDIPDNPFNVAKGNLQPSIDRSGRIVSFRSVARNLSVIRDGSRVKRQEAEAATPAVGEIVRPLYRVPSSNVYLRDRDATGSGILDETANSETKRVSVSRFGYPTNQVADVPSSGSSRNPAVSADGRFIAFASDSGNTGGLRFGRTNRDPLDDNGVRDVFVHDRNTVVDVPDDPLNPPFVAITSPTSGGAISSTSPFFVSASAIGFDETTGTFNQQSIERVTFFVNGNEVASIDSPPFSSLVTPQGAGPIRLIAVAEDSRGLEATSQPVNLEAETVTGGQPDLSLVSPNASINSSFSLGTTTTFEARLQDTAGSSIFREEFDFARFDFYVDGVSVFSTTEEQEVYTFDYTFDETGTANVTAGYVFQRNTAPFVFVNDFSDQVTVTVTPEPGPSVRFTTPAPGSTLALNETVTLSARPTGATDDPIEVEYFLLSETSDTAESLGTATGPNYALDWEVDRTGALSFFAVATQPTGPNGVSERLDVSAAVANNLPRIEIVSHDTTSPRTTVESGGTVQLNATATGQNGDRDDIAGVEFFVNGQSVGTGTRVDPPAGPPVYETTWAPLLPGDVDALPATLTAVVTTTANEIVATSEPVFLDVISGEVPVVNLVQPSSDRLVTVGQSISLAAQASVSGGTIASVRFFYRNTPGNVSSANLIGEDTSSPYTASFTPTSEGTFYIYAVATSNSGRDSAGTPPVAVTAGPLGPPTVELVAPPTTVTVGSDLLLSAEAGDADGEVAQVRFFANGVEVGVSTGGDGSGNVFTTEWSPSAAGTFDIVAEAIDGDGLSSQSNVETVTVNPEIGSAPIVSAGALPSGDSLGRFLLGSTVVLRASARDLDGTVEEVQIFMNGAEVGSFTEEPFTVPFTFTQEGVFVLSAFARDDDGNVTVSSVQLSSLDANLPIPQVDITSPGSTLAVQPGEDVQIVAEADGQGNDLAAVQFIENGTLFNQADSEPYTATFSADEFGTREIQALAFYTTEITFFQPGGEEITLTFAASNVSEPVTVTVAQSVNLVGFGNLLPVDPSIGEFFSGTLGRLFFGTSDPVPGQWAYAFDLDSWVIGISGDTAYSPDFGYISPSGAQQAFESSAFGGTVYWFEREESDTFLWMYSVNLGYIGKPLGTQPFFFVELLDSWIVVLSNGAIFSFEWDYIRPTAPFVFESSSEGTLFMTDDPSQGGAVYSLRKRQFLYP